MTSLKRNVLDSEFSRIDGVDVGSIVNFLSPALKRLLVSFSAESTGLKFLDYLKKKCGLIWLMPRFSKLAILGGPFVDVQRTNG